MNKYFSYILIILFLSSCKKEGCTDVLALNYDSKETRLIMSSCEYYTVTEYNIDQ